MTTSSHSQQLAEFLTSNGLEAVVSFQPKDQSRQDIAIWPYATDLNPPQRNRAAPVGSPSGELNWQENPQRTHVLLLPSTLTAYDRARELVLNNPVLPSSEPRIKIAVETLTLADITSLFSTSGIAFRIALPVAIQ